MAVDAPAPEADTRTHMERWSDRCEQEHRESVERGEHDAQCEYLRTPGFYLCHCSKRRREAAGHTETPELEFQPPTCTRCLNEVESDGDGWTCGTCSVSWSNDGTDAQFYDDYGDLDDDWYQPAAAPEPKRRAVVDVQLPALTSKEN